MPITPADRQKGRRPRVRWTKRRLVSHLSDLTGFPKHNVKLFLETMGATFTIMLTNGSEPYIPNMGRLYVYQKIARGGRNPVTGIPIALPARKWPKFRAGVDLRISI
jgi:DNA-binding protein HU-beta